MLQVDTGISLLTDVLIKNIVLNITEDTIVNNHASPDIVTVIGIDGVIDKNGGTLNGKNCSTEDHTVIFQKE